MTLDAFVRIIGIGGLEHLPQGDHVLQAVDHPGIRRQSVAAGTPGFLVIRLDALGQIQVGDETHIRFVDAHAEGDGGDDDDAFLVEKTRLVPAAHLGAEAGMVGQRIQTLAREPGGHLVHALARQAVDDAGVGGMLRADEAQQLLARTPSGRGLVDAVTDVRPVETADKHTSLLEAEARNDFAPRGFIGGGRQGNTRNAGETLLQYRQLDVFRTEIVPPLGNTVGLIDGEQRQGGTRQQVEGALQHQPLGRDIQQIKLSAQQLLLDGTRAGGIEGGIEKRGAHPGLLEGRHLVLHQGDQRRDHDAGAGARNGRNLKTQGLATAGGHEHQGIAAGHEGGDDLLLRRAKVLVTEDAAE